MGPVHKSLCNVFSDSRFSDLTVHKVMIGTGILKGMAVTARNFIGSYFLKERLITVQYPEERSPLPENYRNFPFLIYDTDDPNAGLRCVACKICEKECPPQCIYIIKSEDKKPDYMGKPQFYPAVFDIDISVCMSCQICVEVCPFEAIKMDKVYELSRRERFDALLMRKNELSKSNTYYHSIHPTEAAEVDTKLAQAAAAAAAKKKPSPPQASSKDTPATAEKKGVAPAANEASAASPSTTDVGATIENKPTAPAGAPTPSSGATDPAGSAESKPAAPRPNAEAAPSPNTTDTGAATDQKTAAVTPSSITDSDAAVEPKSPGEPRRPATN